MQTVNVNSPMTWNCYCEIGKIPCKLLIFPLDITHLEVSYLQVVVLGNKFLEGINSKQHGSQNENVSQLTDFITNVCVH